MPTDESVRSLMTYVEFAPPWSQTYHNYLCLARKKACLSKKKACLSREIATYVEFAPQRPAQYYVLTNRFL